MSIFKLYGDALSGNCYKVQLLLAQLDIPYQWVPIDILAGQSRTPEFLAKNPNGRIPLLEIEPGIHLAESDAILCYLAEGSALFPADRLLRAQILQWLFFEQYSHEPYIAVARFIIRYLGRPADQEVRLQERYAPGYAALEVMSQRLSARPFLVGDRYSIADIGLYAYTHVADEGGFELERFPALTAWLERVRTQPGYLPMGAPPTGF